MYDPIPAHEDAHDRKLEAAESAYERALQHYTLEIRETLTADIRKTPPYRLQLPYVRGSDISVKYQPVSEAVSDMVFGDTEILQLLMDVLHASDCAMVERLRQGLAAEYIKMWADVLATEG